MGNFNEFQDLMWQKGMEEGLLKKLKDVLNPESEFIPTKDFPVFFDYCFSVSEELGLMIQKEIKSLEGKIKVIEKAIDELDKKEKLTKFFDDFRSEKDGGVSLKISTIMHSTELAWFVDVCELGEIWVPKSQSEINGNLLFVRHWWFDKENYNGGKEMHIKDWEKLVPDHFNTFVIQERHEPEGYCSGDSNYCEACMESPCKCSDPF